MNSSAATSEVNSFFFFFFLLTPIDALEISPKPNLIYRCVEDEGFRRVEAKIKEGRTFKELQSSCSASFVQCGPSGV